MLSSYLDLQSYTTEGGKPLYLGEKLGEGGEGSVWALAAYPDLVAKIYSNPIDATQVEKLRALCAMSSTELSDACAWPRSVIYRENQVCGFLMPLISGGTEIHELFGSASRKRLFPNADWGFLIHVSKNLAAAVDALHRANIVVGDLNQRNTVVFPDGTVKLWDCDSFQIERDGKVYYCKVGVPEFTPPELQDCKTFDGVKRNVDHDLFSLAVMIFYLLFMGRHPYSGDLLHSKTTSLELQDAIRNRLFAYSSNARRLGIVPPKNSPPVYELGEHLLPLFSKSFETDDRSSAAQWFTALETLSSQLQRCDINPGHVYPKARRECPWCTHETAWKIVTFLPTACPPQYIKSFDFDVFVNDTRQYLIDLPIALSPPEISAGNNVGKPLPDLIPISEKLRDNLQQANSRLESLNASYRTLLQSWNPDPRIAEIQSRGQTLQNSINANEASVKEIEQRLESLEHERRNAHAQFESNALLCRSHTFLRTSRILKLCWPLVFASNYSIGLFAIAVSALLAAGLAIRPLYFRLRALLFKYQGHVLWDRIREAEQSLKDTNDQYWREEMKLKFLWEEFKNLVSADETKKSEQLKTLSGIKQSIETQLDRIYEIKHELRAAQKEYEESRARRNAIHELRKMRYLELMRQEKRIALEVFKMRKNYYSVKPRRIFLEVEQSYRDAQKKFKRKIDEVQNQAVEHQLYGYLDQFEIERARIPGIGINLVITLRSHGIETAADIDHREISKILGSGDNRIAILELWRDQHVRNFRRAPQQTSQPDNIESAKHQLNSELHLLELMLKKSAKQIKDEYLQAYALATSKMKKLADLREQIKQAFADLQVSL